MLSSYLYLFLFYSCFHGGVLASSLAPTPPSSCEELCMDQDYGTVFSVGCCEKQYCLCSNDADNFMESCPHGLVFCLDRCVESIVCALTDNCCQVQLQSTTTHIISTPTTTPPSNECDRLCIGHNEEFVSEYCCSNKYCFCSSVSGNVEFRCPDQAPFFCESEQSCCQSCGPCPTTTTTSSPSTSPTPSPGHTCSELCLNAGEEELVGECCGEEFCLCSSSGVYEVRCPAGQLYCPLLQDCLHGTTCHSHQDQCCAIASNS